MPHSQAESFFWIAALLAAVGGSVGLYLRYKKDILKDIKTEADCNAAKNPCGIWKNKHCWKGTLTGAQCVKGKDNVAMGLLITAGVGVLVLIILLLHRVSSHHHEAKVQA